MIYAKIRSCDGVPAEDSGSVYIDLYGNQSRIEDIIKNLKDNITIWNKGCHLYTKKSLDTSYNSISGKENFCSISICHRILSNLCFIPISETFFYKP